VEPGLRTPLLDFFRRGEVARDVKLMAAHGVLAPRAHEQLGLLMLLVSDVDPEIGAAAETTLNIIPRDSLAAFLARSDVSAEMRAFFAQRGIEPAGTPATDVDQPMVEIAAAPVPATEPVAAAATEQFPVAGTEPTADTGMPSATPEALLDFSGLTEREPDHASGEEPSTEQSVSTVQRIAAMGIAQRMSLAMKGTREERAVLVRDPNKIVSVAVLSSPKITETEIEAIAKMANVSDEILRIIGSTRAWVKNYNVALALTKNPKTPVALSMNLLSRLNDRDMRMLSIDRNVPDILRITARKKVVLDR
jgi:hypothetical protein